MILKLLRNAIKEKLRSKTRNSNIFLNILLFLVFIYFFLIFGFLGFFMPKIIKQDLIGDIDVYTFINNYLLFYVGIDVFFRIIVQSLPILSIKPYMTLPISRGQISHFLLVRSLFSLFNLFPLVFFGAYITNYVELGLSQDQAIIWLIAVLILIQISNFINILVKRMSNEKFRVILYFLGVYAVIYLLDFYEILFLREYFGEYISTLVRNPILLIGFIGVFIMLYWFNLKYIKSKFNIEELETSNVTYSENEMSWADSLGDIAPYVKLDLKMILRNKRSKSVLFMSSAFLFYGLIFYPNPRYEDMAFMKVFVGIFITGIFAINFGQFVPAWDSKHYNFLMIQKTNLLVYVKSKFAIMSASVIIFLILSTPYVYFGIDILLIHIVGAVYNIGVNILILLLLSSYNNKRIDLDSSSVMNYQGVGAKQWLIVIPILFLPGLIYFFVDLKFGMNAALGTLFGMGMLGIIFHNKLIYTIATQLAERKHKIIEAFKEK